MARPKELSPGAYDGRLGTMEGIRKEYLMNARVTNDATGGVKFMVNGYAVPTYSAIPGGMRRALNHILYLGIH